MRLSILGSTGSIGRQALDIAAEDEDIKVTAIAALKNIDLAEEQICRFAPELCCIFDEERAEELKRRLAADNTHSGMPADLSNAEGAGNTGGAGGVGNQRGTRIVSGMDGLLECAGYDNADTVLISVVGMVGILPTIEAIKAGKHVCQANKESIVCAGHIIMPLIKEYGVDFTPVDSEHSAIYQCLQGEDGNRIDKIILTCSGGPFRGKTKEELKNVRPEDALRHPSWNMGAKITVDSSTLVNKGLEVIEAHYLFGVPMEDIVVAIQPGSIVHSMVQFEDGAIKAQLGAPDMKTPIAYALRKKKRLSFEGRKTLGLRELRDIRFEEPDLKTFKGLALGIEAGASDGTMNTVYNAANEECVSMFLNGRIAYTDIACLIEECMRNHSNIYHPSLDEIFAAEKYARDFVRERTGLSN